MTIARFVFVEASSESQLAYLTLQIAQIDITAQESLTKEMGKFQKVVLDTDFLHFLHLLHPRRTQQQDIASVAIKVGMAPIKRMAEPRLGNIQFVSKPRASIFSCKQSSGACKLSRFFSMSSQKSSVGIMSKAAIQNSTLKIALAFAGMLIAKSGIIMTTYCEATIDQK